MISELSMNNKDVKFSIIIPIYNLELYIEECIESILDQNYLNYEVILIDDGSIDNSLYICKKYEKRVNFKIISTVNQGVMLARQEGLKFITGEYVLFLDGDDRVEFDLLYTLNEIISITNLDMYIFNYSINDSNMNVLKIIKTCDKESYSYSEKSHIIKEAYLNGKLNPLWNKCIKAELVKKMPIYSKNISMGEDAIISYNLIDFSDEIIAIDKVLYAHRVHPSNATSNFKEKYLDDILIVNNEKIRIAKKYYSESSDMNLFYTKSISTLCGMLINYTRKGCKRDVVNKISESINNWEITEYYHKNMGLTRIEHLILNCFSNKKTMTIRLLSIYLKVVTKLLK